MKYALILVALAATAGCSTTTTVQPTETVTVEAPKAAETTAPEPAATPNMEMAIMKALWKDMPRSERDTICVGYTISPELMWDSFKEGADGSISRATFTKFFNRACR